MGEPVRDRIPEVIRGDGEEPVTRALTQGEFAVALLDEAVEEAPELRTATGVQERLAEAADVHEVLLAVARPCGTTIEDVARRAEVERAERGGFEDRVRLD